MEDPDIRLVPARPVHVLAATKVRAEDTGTPMVAVVLGETVDNSALLAMSVADARHLQASLSRAIAASPPGRR